jgi:hypothetical protein
MTSGILSAFRLCQRSILSLRPQGGEKIFNKYRNIIIIFTYHMIIYHINGSFLPTNDTTFSTYLPAILLSKGTFSVTPSGMPDHFLWSVRTDQGSSTVNFRHWSDVLGDSTASQLREQGALTLIKPKYYLTRSVRVDNVTGENEYVNTFGPGPGLLALPIFAVRNARTSDPFKRPRDLWFSAKVAASVFVALSVVFVYLACELLTSNRLAMLIAYAYGLGTCVWSISSQALWQHGPNECFLAMGTYFLLKARWHRSFGVLCGLSYGIAVACRPTSAIVVLAVGANLLLVDRKTFVTYILGGLPVVAALGSYNNYYHGSPLSLGREQVDQLIALQKTGSTDLWQTPLWEGVAGLLFSPSRGLFVYSPFLLFTASGFVRAWKDPQVTALRALTVAIFGHLLVAAKWFDWWGGWSFGYRLIVDSAPLFAVLLALSIDEVWRHKFSRVAFVALLTWSVVVQFLGAFAYDLDGWNDRVIAYEIHSPGLSNLTIPVDRAGAGRVNDEYLGGSIYEVRGDIDMPQYRSRLWSICDNQIWYYIRNFERSRIKKKRMTHWSFD